MFQSAQVPCSLTFYRTNTVLFGEGLPGTTGTEIDDSALPANDDASTGEVHRKHRKELSPVFSKSHIQELVPVFDAVARKVCILVSFGFLVNFLLQLRDALNLLVRTNPKEVDMLPWAARVALELVGQAGLGMFASPIHTTPP